MATINYDQSDPQQRMAAKALQAIIDNKVSSDILYSAPSKIDKIPKNVKYIRARNLIEAVKKISSLVFSHAYLINFNTDLTPYDRVELRKVLLGMDKKNIHICIEENLPYMEGLSVITKSEGFIQLL